MSGEASKHKADLEWERRVLCSDEACIGTIGPDGICRECGKPYEGELPEALSGQTPEDGIAEAPWGDDETSFAEVIDAEDADETEDDVDGVRGDDDWEQRTLCSDESCIGVIGANGRCKECGKPFKG